MVTCHYSYSLTPLPWAFAARHDTISMGYPLSRKGQLSQLWVSQLLAHSQLWGQNEKGKRPWHCADSLAVATTGELSASLVPSPKHSTQPDSVHPAAGESPNLENSALWMNNLSDRWEQASSCDSWYYTKQSTKQVVLNAKQEIEQKTRMLLTWKTSTIQIQIICYAHLWRAVNVAGGSFGDSLLECR